MLKLLNFRTVAWMPVLADHIGQNGWKEKQELPVDSIIGTPF